MNHDDEPPRKLKRPQPRTRALRQATMNATMQAQEAQRGEQAQSQAQTQQGQQPAQETVAPPQTQSQPRIYQQSQTVPSHSPGQHQPLQEPAQNPPKIKIVQKQAPIDDTNAVSTPTRRQAQQQQNTSTPTQQQHMSPHQPLQSPRTPQTPFSPQEPSYSHSPSTPVIQEDTYPHGHRLLHRVPDVDVAHTPEQAKGPQIKSTKKSHASSEMSKDPGDARQRLATQSKKVEQLEQASASLASQNSESTLVKAGVQQHRQQDTEKSQILDLLPQVAKKDWKIDALQNELDGLKGHMKSMQAELFAVTTHSRETDYENRLMQDRIRELEAAEAEHVRRATQRRTQAGADAGNEVMAAIETLYAQTGGEAGAFGGGDIGVDGEYEVDIESLAEDGNDDSDDEDDDDDEFADETTITGYNRKLDAIIAEAIDGTNDAALVTTVDSGSDTEVVPDQFEYYEGSTDEDDEDESIEQHQLSAILEEDEDEDEDAEPVMPSQGSSVPHATGTTLAPISKKRKYWGPDYGGDTDGMIVMSGGSGPSPKRQNRGHEASAPPPPAAQQQQQQQQQQATPQPMTVQEQDQIKAKDKIIERYRSRQWRIRDLAEMISRRKVTTRERAIVVKQRWLMKHPNSRLVR